MFKSEPAIIKPDHVFDFSLLGKIFPAGVIVGERFMRLDTIEEVSYSDDIDDPDNRELAISHTSGFCYIFSGDEARELEVQIKTVLKKNEDQLSRMDALQQEVHLRGNRIAQLERELAQLTLQQMQGGKIVVPDFKRH